MGGNKKDKKKNDRKTRLERFRAQNVLPKVTEKDRKFGKIGLWIMGGVIIASAIFVFTHMG